MTAPTVGTSATDGFSATASLTSSLQRVLVDLIDLHLQGKQAHWNVTGPGFRSLHLQLDELVAETREHSDTIAERMRALAAVPDGRTETIASTSDLTAFPAGLVNVPAVVEEVKVRIAQTVAVVRSVHEKVDAEDPTSADLLNDIVADLEKQAWFIGSQTLEV